MTIFSAKNAVRAIAALAIAGLATVSIGARAQDTDVKGKTFAYITPGLDLPFWRHIAKGVETGITKAGGNVLTLDSRNDASAQLKNAQDAISKGVAGIVLSPTDSSTAPSVLALAERAHVPVVIADIGTNGGNYATFVSSDNEKGAYETGQKVAEMLKAKGWTSGGFGMITVSLARKNGQLRTAGFRKAMKEAGVPEVGLNQLQRYTGEEAFKYTQDMITAHPDMRALFVQVDVASLGSAKAIQAARKNDDLMLAAFDGVEDFIAMLRDGRLAAFGMQQPNLMGEKAADALVEAAQGKTPPKSIVVPVVVITKDNLDANMAAVKQTVAF
ncbi:substrate-binding domain-containing protein [Pararobbsia silviterrae]|uniref:Ribose ABC transporter substrate-binding protein n=1 Tax=Pararobbsia silviterrae TaxID=1792498 RepID=A0A494XT08_9BURK|nr:substrate-binding domain-containing protein [Pararobbsia silviterrae]RKP53737.1 ribose ABC transporter substrate-binding protein [Pararobbsia silviterrae]